MIHPEACWITGVGAATPLGNSYPVMADNLLAGRSGIRRVQGFDVSQHPSQIAGQIEPVACPLETADPLERLAWWCCSEALRDAGWWDRRAEVRIGLVVGVGAEWLLAWEVDQTRLGETVAQRTARALGLSGPVVTLSAACASGNHALDLGRRWLRLGWVDVCLAGACDIAVTPMSLAGFGNLRALSRRNDEPEKASRPFDRGRDGFVMSEGGVVFTLERAESAQTRSAHVYGEVAGCGATSDAHHMVIPSPDPGPAAEAMRRAFIDSGVSIEEIDYVNAHATGTPVGDVAEARVLKAVLGAAVRRVPVSSTKGMTGHLLTAAAAMEALACLVALERQAVPATINLDDPDPECDLCHVAHEAQPRRVRVAVSNSFGFGGSNTSLVLREV